MIIRKSRGRTQPKRRGRLFLSAMVGFVSAGAILGGTQAPPDLTQAPPDIQMSVNEALGLMDGLVFSMPIDTNPGEPVFAAVPIDGQWEFVDLYPWSNRSDKYQVFVQGADGALREVEPGPVHTLRGDLMNIPFSNVAGSLEEDGLYARIMLPDGTVRIIEPLSNRIVGAQPDLHVIYLAEDVIRTDEQCGTDQMRFGGRLGAPGNDPANATPNALGPQATFGGTSAQPSPTNGGSGGYERGGCLYVTELACDADFEYFNRYGSVANVEARINSVINTVNQQYERDVSISHQITAIIVRTSEPDPYSSSNAETLLTQFRDYWNANHRNIQRDVAELFTGKNLNGGTIGIAWLSAICTTNGYSVVQSDFNGNFASATDLSAHELGHNWGADHCTCSTYTMNPFITSANRFHPSFSIPEIIAFRDTRSCINCNGGNTPIEVPNTVININRGTYQSGNLNSINTSDNNRYVVSSGVHPRNGINLAAVTVVAQGSFNPISQLDVTIELSGTRIASTRLFLFNFTSRRWEKIASFRAGTSDGVRQISITNNPSRYHNARGRIKFRVLTTRPWSAYDMQIDHVEILVTEQ